MRITKREAAEIKALRQRAQRKIRRLASEGIENVITFPNYSNRKELNQYKEALRDFTNRYNTRAQFRKSGDFVYTVFEKNALERAQRQTNRAIRKNPDKYEAREFFVIGEERQGINTGTKRTVGQDRYARKPVQFTKGITSFKSKKEYEDYMETLQRAGDIDLSVERMIDNFKKALTNVFGDDATQIIKNIESMSSETFMDMYYQTDVINFEYPYSYEEYNAKLDYLLFATEKFMDS